MLDHSLTGVKRFAAEAVFLFSGGDLTAAVELDRVDFDDMGPIFTYCEGGVKEVCG